MIAALPGCETLPGATRETPAAAFQPTIVAPMPPPARPRTPGTAAVRFREAGTAENQAVPPPPPSPASNGATAGPPLVGDSAASEVARSEPAAPPAPAAPPVVAAVPPASPASAPAPAPAPIEPASTVGATSAALRERFGAPERQTPIGSGTTWHYERESCRASFVLLPELSSGALRVFSYEITPPEGAMFGPAGCLGRIAAARGPRTAGTTP